jgi:hypothetical protein
MSTGKYKLLNDWYDRHGFYGAGIMIFSMVLHTKPTDIERPGIVLMVSLS